MLQVLYEISTEFGMFEVLAMVEFQISVSGFPSAAFGVLGPDESFTTSGLLPFNGGKSKLLLLPTCPSFQEPTLDPRYPLSQTRAPTQG